MDLKYKKVMEENGLTYADLPEDAQTGIESINEVLKAFRMNEKNGKAPTPKSLKKLSAMDKWVVYEIYDYLHDTDNNDDDIPFEADDVLEGDENINNEPKVDPIGLKIDKELESLFETGQTTFSFDEIRSEARTTYNVLFDSYDEDEDNGVETSNFSLIESSDKIFTLKKK